MMTIIDLTLAEHISTNSITKCKYYLLRIKLSITDYVITDGPVIFSEFRIFQFQIINDKTSYCGDCISKITS